MRGQTKIRATQSSWLVNQSVSASSRRFLAVQTQCSAMFDGVSASLDHSPQQLTSIYQVFMQQVSDRCHIIK